MAQIQGKWIATDSVTGAKIRLANDEYLKGRNNGDTGNINIAKVTASDLVEFGVQPQFTGTPSTDNDLVNRGYVLGALAGARDPKDACVLATTANIDLSTGTLLTIDGVVTVAGDRVLVKDQTAGEENGIYVAGVGAWSRATDADASDEVTQGMSTLIMEGTLNARRLYALATDAVTLDTTVLSFVQIPNPANFLVPKTTVFTLDATDISNGYVDLAYEAISESIQVNPIGGPMQEYGVDFTLSVVSNVTRVTFAGDLVAQLVATDDLQISYSYATA